MVNGAKEKLTIVSPWLSRSTADIAVRRQDEGVDVEMITTLDTSNVEALQRLITRKSRIIRPSRTVFVVLGALLVALGIVGLCISLVVFGLSPASVMTVVSLVAGSVLLYIGLPKTESYLAPRVGKLTIYEPGSFHCKVYLADDTAAIGSCNFTYRGLTTNVEAMVFLSGDGMSAAARQEIETLKTDPLLRELSLESVVAQIALYIKNNNRGGV